jgi:hypothetical protein
VAIEGIETLTLPDGTEVDVRISVLSSVAAVRPPPAPSNPTILSAVVPAAGNTIVITFSRAVTGHQGFALLGGFGYMNNSYVSGEGTAVYTYTIPGGTVYSGSNPSLQYFFDGSPFGVPNGDVASAVGELPLAQTVVGVTNNSTVPPPPPPPAPAFTSPNNATFTQFEEESFAVTTANHLDSVTVAGDLPNGVMYQDNYDGTGTLSGMAIDTGVFSLTFTAGVTTQDFTLTVVE